MRNPILPFIMLLLLAVALYLLPDGSFTAWRLALQGALVRLYRPVQQDVSLITDPLANERDLLEVLQQKNAEIADMRRQLRDLGISGETVPSARIIPARLVQLGPANALDSFTLNVGSESGVEPGQAVVVGQSLVGVVVRAEENASLVLSLSSPGCYVSTRLSDPDDDSGRPRPISAVRGVGSGGVRAIVFSSSTDAAEGWLAMTSGLEASIPEGFIIGTVNSRFEEGLESGTLEAELRPAIDPSTLDYVVVVAREQ